MIVNHGDRGVGLLKPSALRIHGRRDMRGKLFFSAATAALLLVAPGAIAQTGDQPGDSSTQAEFTGAALDGELAPAGDVDWYRMHVEHGQRYNITLDAVPGEDGAAVDPMLGVYDAQGNQLAFNDDTMESLNSALRFSPQQSGDVFVEVRAYSDQSAGRYRLAATSAAIPPDQVGNDAGTRARISAGTPVTGQLEYEGDTDWYRFNVRTGQRYHITLDGAGDEPVGDPLLSVLDAEGAELAMNDDWESLNSALDFTPQRSGEVFIRAGAYADAYAGGYTLNITSERAPTDNISAERSTRGRINIGQSVDGSLDFAGDRDWYRVRLEAGQSYRFTLVGSGGSAVSDPLLRMIGPNGEELAMDDDGGGGLNSYLEFTAPSTGNYYVEAGAFADGSGGGYTLSARAGDVPADSSTDAVLSSDGDWRQGMLAPAGDRDWYRVDLAEGQAMRVGLESTQTADMLSDPYLVLYGPDGTELARDDDGGEGLNAFLEYQATQAGPHYIEARGFTEDAQGAYAISLLAGEIGDSLANADYMTPNGEGRMSTIGADGDADWFMLEIVEGRPYRFNVMSLEEGGLADPALTLYDSNGEQVAYDDDGGSGFNSYLTFVSPTGGTYFAAVSSFGNTGTGRYWLNVYDTDVAGHTATDENLDGANDDRRSRIDMSGDLDYYRVELEAGQSYQIEVNGDGDNPLADPFLAIVNENNETLASDDDSGDGLDARLRFSPEQSGIYYIQASGLGGSIGWYQVSIVRQ
jgi:hypothetical protein